MGSRSRLSELTSRIHERALEIDAVLEKEQLPSPSFDVRCPPNLFDGDDIGKLQQDILQDIDELNALMKGPIGILTSIPQWSMIVLHAIYRFNLATNFPQGKNEATYDEIASNCEIPEAEVKRILRYAMTMHIFCETKEGRVAHTAASKILQTNSTLREWVGTVCEEMWPSAPCTVEAMSRWPACSAPNEAGYNIAHNTSKTCFEDIEDEPARSQRFANSMKLWASNPGFSSSHLIENYPWKTKQLVVDIGGSQGVLGRSLVENFNHLHCVVQDRPEIVAGCDKATPEILKTRLKYMAHDFFEKQPIPNVDVFVLRWVLHDYSDIFCIRILQALRNNIKNGAEIIICEHIVPNPGQVPTLQERFIRQFDLAMLMQINGKERSIEDWKSLLRQADERFNIIEINQPQKSNLGFVIVRWNEVAS